MDITYAMILLAAGLLATIVAQKVVKKVGSRKMFTWIGLGAAGLGLIALLGVVPQLSGLNGIAWSSEAALTVAPQPSTVVAGCNVEDTTVTLAGVNAFTGVATGGAHRYTINGGPAKAVADAGTFTASPGDVLNILWFNVSQTGYFGKITKETIPCKGTEIISTELYTNESTAALDVDFFNRDGNKMDEGIANQSMGASDKKIITLRWSGTSETGYPHGATVVFDLNRTAFDDIVVIGAEKVGTPNSHAVRTTADTTRAFHIDGPIGVEEKEWLVEVTTSATGGVAAVVMSNGVNATFLPENFYIDDDKGGAYAGPAVDDEDNTRTYGNADVVNLFFD